MKIFQKSQKKFFIVDLQLLSKSMGGGLTYIQLLLPTITSELRNDYNFIYIINNNSRNCLKIPSYVSTINFYLTNHLFRFVSSVILLLFFKLKCFRKSIYWGPFNSIGFFKHKNLISISTIHDVMVYDCPENYKTLQLYFRKYQLNKCIKNSDCIISVSQFTKEQILLHSNVNPKSIHVLYEPIKPPIATDIHFTKKLNFNYLLYVGVPKPNKNLPFVVHVFNYLKENHNYLGKLVFVGNFNQEYKDQIYNICKFNSSIIFTGFISDSALSNFYRNADFFVFPSNYEGFGLPPLEAYVNGCRCIVSNHGAIKEICNSFAVLADISSVELFGNELNKSLSIELPVQYHKNNFIKSLQSKNVSQQYITFFKKFL